MLGIMDSFEVGIERGQLHHTPSEREMNAHYAPRRRLVRAGWQQQITGKATKV